MPITPKNSASMSQPDAESKTTLTSASSPSAFTFSNTDISFFTRHTKAKKYDTCKFYVRRMEQQKEIRHTGRGEIVATLYKRESIEDYVQQQTKALMSDNRHINPSSDEKIEPPQKCLGMG